MRSFRATRGTQMSSGPRRSPVAEGCAGGDGPCCHSSPAHGCGRDGDPRPCRPGKPPSSRDNQVRTMHPYMMEELARQRERELRRSAQQHALLGPHRRRRCPARRRPGPALAGIGLALARRRAWLVAVFVSGLRAVSAHARAGVGVYRRAPAPAAPGRPHVSDCSRASCRPTGRRAATTRSGCHQSRTRSTPAPAGRPSLSRSTQDLTEGSGMSEHQAEANWFRIIWLAEAGT